MASLAQLYELISEGDALRNKVKSAVIIAANTTRKAGGATAPQKAWALRVMRETDKEADLVYRIILAEHNAIEKADILNATDQQIQNAVNAAVTFLAGE